MAKNEIVETVYGKRSKYEIIKINGSFGSVHFSIHKDGSYWKGSYDSLSKAVEKAKQAG